MVYTIDYNYRSQKIRVEMVIFGIAIFSEFLVAKMFFFPASNSRIESSSNHVDDVTRRGVKNQLNAFYHYYQSFPVARIFSRGSARRPLETESSRSRFALQNRMDEGRRKNHSRGLVVVVAVSAALQKTTRFSLPEQGGPRRNGPAKLPIGRG